MDNSQESAPEAPETQLSEEEIKASAAAEAASTAAEATNEQSAETDATKAEATAEAEELTPLETAEAEAANWRDRALRAQAELENFRRRSAQESQEMIKFANKRLLEELLPALDNFHLGMMAASQEQSSMIYQGMAMVQKQLQDFLESQGVREIKAEGEFDPQQHEAMEQQASEEVAEGHIIRVVRRGFQLQERLLRPASVIVSSGLAE